MERIRKFRTLLGLALPIQSLNVCILLTSTDIDCMRDLFRIGILTDSCDELCNHFHIGAGDDSSIFFLQKIIDQIDQTSICSLCFVVIIIHKTITEVCDILDHRLDRAVVVKDLSANHIAQSTFHILRRSRFEKTELIHCPFGNQSCADGRTIVIIFVHTIAMVCCPLHQDPGILPYVYVDAGQRNEISYISTVDVTIIHCENNEISILDEEICHFCN